MGDWLLYWATKKYALKTLMHAPSDENQLLPDPWTYNENRNEGYWRHGLDKNDILFENGLPKTKDVNQSNHGNCKWMSVLIALANTPVGRYRLTDGIHLNEAGNLEVYFYRPLSIVAYGLKQHKPGEDLFVKEKAIVSNRIPLEDINANVKGMVRTFPLRYSAKNGLKVVWPILYTKAFAAWLHAGGFQESYHNPSHPIIKSIQGSYERVGSNISASFALSAMLGIPAVTLKASMLTRKQLYQIAKLASKYPTVLGSRTMLKTLPLFYSKIIYRHAYALLGIDESVKDPNDEIVLIKNPQRSEKDVKLTVVEFQKRFSLIWLPREAAVKVLGDQLVWKYSI